MKLWKHTVAAILLAPLAGCVSKSQLQQANQALELENFHLEQRLNDTCWKLEDTQRALDVCRSTGAIPVLNSGGLTPVAPAGSPTPATRDPRSPGGDVDIDKPPKIELPDDEPNMPSAGMRKERAPRYNGPPVISPPDPKVPEGILPHSVSSRSLGEEQGAGPVAEPYREPVETQDPRYAPRDAAPLAEPDSVQQPRPAQAPNWQTPNVPGDQSASPPPQPAPEYVQPRETQPPVPQPEAVSTPRPTPSSAAAQAPEPIAAPAPVQAPESVRASEPTRAPEPVAQTAPQPEPEPISAPPIDFSSDLQSQPDSRPLVEAEPISPPQPSPAARPTSAPSGRKANVANNPPAGKSNPANNAAIHLMAVNPKLTVWRQSSVGNSPDDGLTVVVEPRSAAGEMVDASGDVSIVVLDPAVEGPGAKIARWDFPAEKLAGHFKGTQAGGGLHFQLEWPAAPPTANRLELFVRLTLSDRREFMAEYTLEPTAAAAAPSGAPAAAPEPNSAPSEPPPGPPASAPASDGVSPTAAWTNVDDPAPPQKSNRRGFVNRANADSSAWRRSSAPLPAAQSTAAPRGTPTASRAMWNSSTPSAALDRPAAGAAASTTDQIDQPALSSAQADSTWSPYR